MNENAAPLSATIGSLRPGEGAGERFQIQIFPDSVYILRRESDQWKGKAAFSSMTEAFEYVESLPGADDAQMTILDDEGVRFARVVLR
jgi:hypothetical protein